VKKDQSVYIEHILLSINQIDKYLGKATYEYFLENEMMRDAIALQIGIIGEISSKISDEIKNSYNFILWADIKGMRNKIFHDYFGINFLMMWDVIKNDLPKLKKDMLKILEDLNPQLPIKYL